MTDYTYIVEAILDKKCVLVLGPEFARNAAGVSFDKDFAEMVKAKNNRDIQYYANEDLFYFYKPRARVETVRDLKKYYETVAPNQIYRQVAEIPFHFVISLTPDKTLFKILDSAGQNVKYSYYHRNQEHPPMEKSDEKSVLLYNLLGNVEQDDSLVLTHDDMFNYLHSILGDFGFPIELSLMMKNASHYILLGFRFEKWQTQLLLRLLTFRKENPFVKLSTNEKANADIETFYNDQLEIEFIPNDYDRFISELKSHFKPDQLRKLSEEAQSFPQKIRNLIKNDKLQDALEELENHAAQKGDSDLQNTITMQSASYNATALKLMQGRLKQEDANLVFNNVRFALLELVEKLN